MFLVLCAALDGVDNALTSSEVELGADVFFGVSFDVEEPGFDGPNGARREIDGFVGVDQVFSF